MTTTAMQLTGVTKSFATRHNRITAVDAVNLSINTGEVVALLGPNGAGKTTTIDMMLGFTSPTQGTVTVLGAHPRQAARSGQLGAMLQDGGLLPDFTVKETLTVLASCMKSHAPVGEVMARTDLDAVASRKVSKCSGGERQRLGFAAALLGKPRILLLDEPTAGMDVAARRSFWHTMRQEAAQGLTIVFATHYLAEAEQFAPRTVLMHQGRIVADAPTDQVRRQCAVSTVSFTVAPEHCDAITTQVGTHPDVVSAHHESGRIIVKTRASDRIAALALGEWQGRDLQVSPGSLDDAFLHLTGDAA